MLSVVKIARHVVAWLRAGNVTVLVKMERVEIQGLCSGVTVLGKAIVGGPLAAGEEGIEYARTILMSLSASS